MHDLVWGNVHSLALLLMSGAFLSSAGEKGVQEEDRLPCLWEEASRGTGRVGVLVGLVGLVCVWMTGA